jgi:biopolymer transport protein ExbD
MVRMSKMYLAAVAFATSFAVAQNAAAPPLQKGVRVEMAATRNAKPMADADSPVAWIVTVTADGKLYFGIDLVTPDQLANDMKTHPRDRDAKLYVKADGRAPFSDVQKVFEIAREVYFEEVVLLTSQPGVAHSAGIVLPMGIAVDIGSAPKQVPTVLQVIKSARQPLVLRINNQAVKESALETTLETLLRNQPGKTISVKVAGPLLFAQFVQVIDSCSAADGKILIQGS